MTTNPKHKCMNKRFTNMLENAKLTFNQHQYDGVKWCVTNELRKTFGVRGGFITDEMGLGKTIMMIGTIVCHYVGATLIVLPPVLMAQWQKEIKRTTGHDALIYHGENKKKITIQQLQKAPIVLTTYNGIHEVNQKPQPKQKQLKEQNKQNEQKENILHKVEWARVVFDEAHHLRNKTRSLEGCLLLRSKIRWLITGTPIQNKITDFYNLCNAAGINREVARNQDNHVKIINKLVLRRTKQQAGIQIPQSSIITNLVAWETRVERELAEEIHASLKFSNVLETKAKQLGRRLKDEGMLQLVLRAKQSCILPKMMASKLTTMVEKRQIPREYLEKTWSSSKLNNVVRTIVERKDNGNGKIVFCHYREEIDTLANRLRTEGQMNVVTFDGRNNVSSRQRILNGNTNVLILQIQTGCEGLNLQQHYSEIYFVSPHWNPSVEDQAIGRCHRIGQKKQVQVFRFEMEGFPLSLHNLEEGDEGDEEEEPTISIDNYIKNIQTGKRTITQKLLSN